MVEPDIQEADHPAVQAIEHMGRSVTERSGNRHTVRVFHSGQLGDEGRTIEQTLAGTDEWYSLRGLVPQHVELMPKDKDCGF
jgi:TRAP-type C4-dicarboxylate transport system substrate-binding protein